MNARLVHPSARMICQSTSALRSVTCQRLCWALIAVAAVALAGCEKSQGPVAAKKTYDDCVLDNIRGLASPHLLNDVKQLCKRKYPATFDFDKIAEEHDTYRWRRVLEHESYKPLTDTEKARVVDQYFDDLVKPFIHPDFIDEARVQFSNYAKSEERRLASLGTSNPARDNSSGSHAETERVKPSEPSIARQEDLPENGQVFQRLTRKGAAPLSIVTSDPSHHFLVKLEDWSTGQTVLSTFVRGGRSISTLVPTGDFRLKYATGKQWFGESRLFGPDTTYFQAEKQFEFSEKYGKAIGYTIELYSQPDGNMATVRIDRSKW